MVFTGITGVSRTHIFRQFGNLIPEVSKIEFYIVGKISTSFTMVAYNSFPAFVAFGSAIDWLCDCPSPNADATGGVINMPVVFLVK